MSKILHGEALRIKIGWVIGISMPTLLLAIAFGTFVWFIIEIKRKRIQVKTMATWLVFNTLYTIVLIYIFIVQLLQIFGFLAPNIFSLFTFYVLGLELPNGMEWIFIWIFGFITYGILKTMVSQIHIARLDQRIDNLNQEVAILKGQINKTADFSKLPLTIAPLSAKEMKLKLKDQLKKVRAEIKTERKLQEIEAKYMKKNPKLKDDQDFKK